LNRINRLPGVQSVAFSDHLLLGEGFPAPVPFYLSNRDQGNQAASTERRTVHPNFFATMKVPLRLGRLFTERDNSSAPRAAIVNEAFVRAFSLNSPIGMHVSFSPNPRDFEQVEVIGVVGDAKTNNKNIEGAVRPMLYTTVFQESPGRVVFTVRTATNPGSVLPALRGAVNEIDPTLPLTGLFTHLFVTEWALIEPETRVLGPLTQIAGGLALMFAMIGLFSLMSYVVARRTTEIGLRMSLGAQRMDVLLSIMRETLTLVLIGVAIGVSFAVVLTPALNTQFLGLSPHDPLTIIAVMGLTVFVAAVAGYLPARRASRVDPLVALRHN